MDFGQLDTAWPLALGCSLLYLPFLAMAILLAPWRALVARNERQHAFLACLVALPLLWTASLELSGGLNLHLLGLTMVTLVFGWQLALVIGTLAGVASWLIGDWTLANLPLNLVLVVLLPVLVTLLLLAAANRLRRTNLFVYMLGVGFLGGLLAFLVTAGAVLWLSGRPVDPAVLLLLPFAEGWLNGSVITALTVFFPNILRTYDDVRYLGDP